MNQAKVWKPKQPGTLKSNGITKYKKHIGVGGGIALGLLALFLLISYFFFARPVLALRSNVKELEKDFNDSKLALVERDLVAFNAALDETEKDLEELRKTRNEKLGWAKNFPKLKIYYTDSERFINAGQHAVNAGREFSVIVEPFSSALGLKTRSTQNGSTAPEGEDIGLMEAFSAWVAAMPLVAAESDPVIKELTLMGEELEKVDAQNYPEDFRGFPVRSTIEQSQTTLTQLNDYAPDIKKALVIIPGLLGVGGEEKRYMIIMQNDKEIRATGGFWTYLATFKVSNGLLNSDFTSYNSYYVDDVLNQIDAVHTFPTVPPTYNKHLKVERMFARDANVSPDLPTSVDQFLEFWTLASPLAPNEFKPIDGVVVIDTKVLEELLEITGPATVNGFTYTKDNVVLELEKLASLALREQVNRKKVLGDLMEQMLINVFESDKNLWPKLVDKGFNLVGRKHIAMVMMDPEAQALIEKHNLAGRIVDPVDGDYAFVVQTNLGGDKTNWFVTKDVQHDLTRENGKWKRKVTINYKYTRPSNEFASFVTVYREWVRLYVPKGSELITLSGSSDEPGTGEERNKTYFHGFFTLGPDETKTVTFEYYLPDGVIKDGNYKLYIQKQLSVDKEKHVVNAGGQSKELVLDILDGKFSTKVSE
jgi:hypothetical protein